MKICSKCGVEKHLSEFGTRKNRHGNMYTYAQCIQCQTEYKREHRARNINAYKNREKAYAEENKEHIRIYKHLWGQENKERRAETNKRRYNAKREYILAKNKEYVSTIPGIKARKQSALNYYTNVANKIKISARDKLLRAIKNGIVYRPGECSACGLECTPEGHHIDYEKPLDVVWLCKKCHTDTHHLNEG